MLLPNKSNDQQKILYAIQKNNVIVDSIAGSGKTTTILHIANEFQDKNILLLTYNKRLKFETREKKELLKLKNIEIHSYHSFGFYYYDKKCNTDQGIIDMIKKKFTSFKKFEYDIIILDEAQDISKLYFEFICKIIANISKTIKSHIVAIRRFFGAE